MAKTKYEKIPQPSQFHRWQYTTTDQDTYSYLRLLRGTLCTLGYSSSSVALLMRYASVLLVLAINGRQSDFELLLHSQFTALKYKTKSAAYLNSLLVSW